MAIDIAKYIYMEFNMYIYAYIGFVEITTTSKAKEYETTIREMVQK